MSEAHSLLMIEFLDWVACQPRTYEQAMEAWRSSCPRLTVWEDALIAGLIQMDGGPRRCDYTVTLTQQGEALLNGRRIVVGSQSSVVGRRKKAGILTKSS